MILYLLFGVLFNWAWDYISDKAENEEIRFSMWERFFALFIWPIYLTVFLYNFFKTINGRDD